MYREREREKERERERERERDGRRGPGTVSVWPTIGVRVRVIIQVYFLAFCPVFHFGTFCPCMFSGILSGYCLELHVLEYKFSHIFVQILLQRYTVCSTII